jgi:primosomal protein N' (replication factor Y)
VAEERARLNNCPLILGTATPSLESYYKAKRGEYKLIKLTKRIDERLLPKVKIVDMRMELATRRRVEIFSKILLDAINKTLTERKQAIIFLNRRGFSTFLNCKRCGLVLKCRRCDAVLVYHFDEKKLVCHYCGFKAAPPDICPKCRSSYIRYFGIGTEKVESEIGHNFPQAHIARMDSDATAERGSHDRILGEFKTGGVNMLVGTQMIAKGLDFPQVTLVGVVSADATLNLPDFRASERTFSLLTQVAGRAGRGEDGGEVIIQTYAPGHYSIQTAAKHDYEKFYEEEIVSRKELEFPPFMNLVKVTVRARNDDIAQKTAAELAERLKAEEGPTKVGGAAPAPVARVRGYFRYNVLVKGKDRIFMCGLLRKVLAGFRKPAGTLIAVDVDPISM